MKKKKRVSSTSRKPRPIVVDPYPPLPEIDFELAERLMVEDIQAVPEGWPHNWQHLVALRDITLKIRELTESQLSAQNRLVLLNRSYYMFKEWFWRGDLWIGVKSQAQLTQKRLEETVPELLRHEPELLAEWQKIRFIVYGCGEQSLGMAQEVTPAETFTAPDIPQPTGNTAIHDDVTEETPREEFSEMLDLATAER